MNPIRIITASAGSGKTYRLAEELYDAVSSGDARPEAILATTFTVKAASELKQRVRGRLLKSGLCAEAERLGAARFGTVNAVCERLVDEYAFELGLPPGMSVLDEEAADRTMREVISSVLTDDEIELAGRLDQAFQKWEWREVVGEIVAHARSNGIPAEALPGFAERSRKGCLALLGRPESDGTGLERKLIEAGESFLEVFPSLSDPTSTTGGIVSNLRLTLRKLREGPVAWKEWARLASANTGVRSRDAFAVVSEAASAHDRHPGLRSDVTAAIDLVFELAGRSMREYQTYKQTHGVI
ncbi:MAG: UvrD-helicase domain-containing protein, partial [Candidatus Fermentibacter daniensis]|nr:UvrD-helicase domain-containing protein [Candidatus Fermentibacter daniensis]